MPRPAADAARIALLAMLLLVVLEGAARVALPSRAGSRLDLFNLVGADGRAALAEIRDPDALIDGAYRLFERDRLLLWRLRPGLDLDASELSLVPAPSWRVRTGPDGFRGAAEGGVWALGDSCTFGWGVQDDEPWPALLDAMDDRGVRNLGVPGYSLAQGRALLEMADGPGPEVLVLAFGANDGHMTLWPDDAVLEARRGAGAWLGWRLSASRLVIGAQDLAFGAVASVADARWRSGDASPRVSAEQYAAHLDAIAARGVPVVLIDVCARDEYGAALRAASARYDWPLVEYKAVSGETIDGCHPTPDGHRALANAVAEAMR